MTPDPAGVRRTAVVAIKWVDTKLPGISGWMMYHCRVLCREAAPDRVLKCSSPIRQNPGQSRPISDYCCSMECMVSGRPGYPPNRHENHCPVTAPIKAEEPRGQSGQALHGIEIWDYSSLLERELSKVQGP